MSWIVRKIKNNLENYKGRIEIVNEVVEAGWVQFRLNGNGLSSDSFNEISQLLMNRIDRFNTHFDTETDTTIMKVWLSDNETYIQQYNGWNGLTGTYVSLWSLEDVKYQIERAKELGYDIEDNISDEKLKRYLEDSLDNEYISEIVNNSIIDYLSKDE